MPRLCLILLTLCLCWGGSLAKAQTSPLVKQLSAVGKTFRLEYEAKTEGALERFMAEIESLGQAHPAKREPWEMLANVGDWVTDTAEKKRAYTRLAKLDAERYSMLVKGAREELDWLRFLETPMELKFTASDGRKVGLAKLRGKVVLIYFCASWCPPCVHEFPIIKSVYDWYHKKGFEIVGISAEKLRAQFDRYTKAKNIPWPQLHEDRPWESGLFKRFRVRYIPRQFLLDRTGRIAAQDVRKKLEEEVRKLMGEAGNVEQSKEE